MDKEFQSLHGASLFLVEVRWLETLRFFSGPRLTVIWVTSSDEEERFLGRCDLKFIRVVGIRALSAVLVKAVEVTQLKPDVAGGMRQGVVRRHRQGVLGQQMHVGTWPLWKASRNQAALNEAFREPLLKNLSLGKASSRQWIDGMR